jgi:hypothetical protein
MNQALVVGSPTALTDDCDWKRSLGVGVFGAYVP